MHLDAITYSLLRIWRTSVRTTFAMLVQLVTPITTEIVTTFGVPRIACSKITSSRFGMLRRISVSRMSSVSSHCGAMPLIPPNTTAITVEINVENSPINSEIRPPYQILEKISRPIVSVPNRNSRSGARL